MEETELYFNCFWVKSERKKNAGRRHWVHLSRKRSTSRISRRICIWKDNGLGYANIVPDKQSTVYGALYICLKGSLAKLEEHEAGRLQRVIVQVEWSGGEIMDATAYQACEEY